MKDYIREISRETSLLFKYYPWRHGFFYLPCLAVGLWIGSGTPEGQEFRFLPFYPTVASIVLLLTMMVFSDIHLKKLRKKGVL